MFHAPHHIFLLLPLLALGLFAVLPWQLAMPLYVAVMIGSLAAYWKALQAARRPAVTGSKAMIGGQAVVLTADEGEVEVDYQGEIWRAVSPQPLHAGQKVNIVDVDGLTLRVTASGRGDGDWRGR